MHFTLKVYSHSPATHLVLSYLVPVPGTTVVMDVVYVVLGLAEAG